MAYLVCPSISMFSASFPPQMDRGCHWIKVVPASGTLRKADSSKLMPTKKGRQLLGCCNPQRNIVYVCCSHGRMIHEDDQGRNFILMNSWEAKTEEDRPDLGVEMALGLLRFYRKEISPLIPASCRYVPTCSEYAMQAYKRYGVLKGNVLTAWRLCRCNPLGGSGFDPPRWFNDSNPPPQ